MIFLARWGYNSAANIVTPGFNYRGRYLWSYIALEITGTVPPSEKNGAVRQIGIHVSKYNFGYKQLHTIQFQVEFHGHFLIFEPTWSWCLTPIIIKFLKAIATWTLGAQKNGRSNPVLICLCRQQCSDGRGRKVSPQLSRFRQEGLQQRKRLRDSPKTTHVFCANRPLRFYVFFWGDKIVEGICWGGLMYDFFEGERWGYGIHLTNTMIWGG